MSPLARTSVAAVTIAACWLLAPVSAIPQPSGADSPHQALELKKGGYRFQSEDGWVEVAKAALKRHFRKKLDARPLIVAVVLRAG